MSIEVPDCTLPTAERPVRLAEFEELFAGATRHVERVSACHLRMQLAGPAGLASQVRDLTARETRCCSFFTFTITPQGTSSEESLTLDVEVPASHADVLESFGQLAGLSPASAEEGSRATQ